MGVVTDKSLQGLTTAVTNISATGMSDSTGQAINTTLGTLGKDTSLQDINTTLQSLVGAISPSASNVTFDNTGTGLSASNAQSAIAEVASVTTAIQHTQNLSLTSDADGYAKLPIQTTNTILISAFANGVIAFPLNGGDGWWYVKFVNPSTLAPYANLTRFVTFFYYAII